MADHHFNPVLAQEYGIDVAVFLHNIYFWLKYNKAYEKNYYEGRYWTFNSLAAFSEAHPYWSRRQIERIIATCKENGLLLKGCFNQDKRDRTSWYSLSDKALVYFTDSTTEMADCISPNGEMHDTERGQAFHQTGTPLPDINPDNSQTDKPPKAPQRGARRRNQYELEEDAKPVLREYCGQDQELAQALADLIDVRTRKKAVNSKRAIVYGTDVKMPLGFVTRLAQTAKPTDWNSKGPAWKDLHTSNVITITGKEGKALFKEIALKAGLVRTTYSNGDITWIMNEATRSRLVAEGIEFNSAAAIVSGINGSMPVVGGDIETLEFMKDGDIAFGHLDLYTMVERAGISVSMSEHARFVEDQTLYKDVRFKSTAAVPLLYRRKFNRDLLRDIRAVAEAMSGRDANSTDFPLQALATFENLAYIMAKHAEPDTVPDSPEEWLDGFPIMPVYAIFPVILDLWSGNMEGLEESKKKRSC